MEELDLFKYDVNIFIESLEKGGPGSGRREESAISEYRSLIGRYNKTSAQFKDDKDIKDYLSRLKSSWRSHIIDLANHQATAIRSTYNKK
jgi:hypothetical protein